jgi:hypothetical protein
MFNSAKYITIIIALFFSLTIMSTKKSMAQIGNTNLDTERVYHIGDCFLFKDSIDDFGLILIDVQESKEGQLHDLFPVKLDKSRKGLDQFKFGKVYISQLPDKTKSNGVKDGFMGFIFMQGDNVEFINRLMSYQGSLKINKKYVNTTGGTRADDYRGFQIILNQWNEIFGFYHAKKIQLNEVLD